MLIPVSCWKNGIANAITKCGRYFLFNMVLKGSCFTDFATSVHLISSSNSGSISMVDPLILCKAFLACSILPRSTKLFGVSVMRREPIVITIAGTTASPRESLHPHVCLEVAKFMQLAMTTPIPKKN
ncbi:sugar transport protein [Trifolium repens]|nr:sugar transport protein [Trifolium repens]